MRGQFFLIVLTLLVSVSAIPPAHAARPGNYTDYYFDQQGPFYNLDIYLTWEVAPSLGFIYPAFTFGFQNGQGGYMGTQLVGDTKTALFSIWDTAEGSETAQPNAPNCRRFSGEGTGAQCPINYDWVVGREYRLRVWAAGSDANGENWVAAIYDSVTEVETQIGLVYLKNTDGYKGYGWLKNSASIFLEYFGGEDTCVGQPFSRVSWRGPYANAGAYAASRAVVPSYPQVCSTSNVLSSGRLRVTHEAGDDVQTTTPPGSSLWEKAPSGAVGSIQHVDLDYRGRPPSSDGSDQLEVEVGTGTSLVLLFSYKEGNAHNEYAIRAYPEWDKSSYIAREDNGGTELSQAWEAGGQRYGIGEYTVPSEPGTYTIRVVYSASSAPPRWDRYDRLLAEGTITVKQVKVRTTSVYVYSLPYSYLGQDPAGLTGSDLHAPILVNYVLNGESKSMTDDTPFRLEADVSSEVSFSVISSPSGWEFSDTWDQYEYGRSPNTSTLEIRVPSGIQKIAAFFKQTLGPQQALLSVSVSPNPVTIQSGDNARVTYTFTEMSGVGVHVTSRNWVWLLSDGSRIIPSSGSNDVNVGARSSASWVDNPYLPSDIVQRSQQLGSSSAVLTTTFHGTDSNGNHIDTEEVRLTIQFSGGPPSPVCSEGAVNALEMCPDGSTWTHRQVCRNNAWSDEYQQCPASSSALYVSLEPKKGRVRVGDSFSVRVTVRNTGAIAADSVVVWLSHEGTISDEQPVTIGGVAPGSEASAYSGRFTAMYSGSGDEQESYDLVFVDRVEYVEGGQGRTAKNADWKISVATFVDYPLGNITDKLNEKIPSGGAWVGPFETRTIAFLHTGKGLFNQIQIRVILPWATSWKITVYTYNKYQWSRNVWANTIPGWEVALPEVDIGVVTIVLYPTAGFGHVYIDPFASTTLLPSVSVDSRCAISYQSVTVPGSSSFLSDQDLAVHCLDDFPSAIEIRGRRGRIGERATLSFRLR